MEIINDGASIKIVNGTQSRDINKSQIKVVEVIKTNIIKIDIGEGALRNVFVPYASVTNPVTASADELRAAINAMLPGGSSGGVGSATEAKQDAEITLLNTVNTSVLNLSNIISANSDKTFYEPSMIDDTGANIVYKGYSATSVLPNQPNWAIERIRIEAGIEVHTWADGDKAFDNVWNDREGLIYK